MPGDRRLSFCTALGLLALLAGPAHAHHIDSANITATCSDYTISVCASDLTPGNPYTITWSISGYPAPVSGSISFTPQSSSYCSGPITKPVGPFTGTFNLSGTATLVGENTISASVSPNKLSCSSENPPCTKQASISSGFNGTAITGTSSGPAYIWFNSNISLKNMPAGATVTLTGSQVVINGTSYTVPNATITFANVSCATTSYDAGSNSWNTTVPLAGSDEIFLSGVAVPVTNLPGGADVTWKGTFGTSQPGICLSWKWGAAAYKTWLPDYNSDAIKPAHSGACSGNGGDHAGAPQNATVRSSVTGGARGGGGSNFTGSWSSTGSVCPPCASIGRAR